MLSDHCHWGSASFQSCKESLPAVGLSAACRNTSLGRPLGFVLLCPPNRATIAIWTSRGVQEQCVTLTATCSATRISSSTCSFLVHKEPHLSHLCFRPRTNSHNFGGSNGSQAKHTGFFIEERWELKALHEISTVLASVFSPGHQQSTILSCHQSTEAAGSYNLKDFGGASSNCSPILFQEPTTGMCWLSRKHECYVILCSSLCIQCIYFKMIFSGSSQEKRKCLLQNTQVSYIPAKFTAACPS